MIFRAKYPGRCAACGKPIVTGEAIEWSRGAGSRHAACVAASPSTAPATSPPAARECLIERYGNAWAFRGPIETKDVPKTAGWRWHPADCSSGRFACAACPHGLPKKTWWTDSAEKLGDLVRHYEAASGDKPALRFSDAETERLARSTAEATAEALAASRATDADAEIPVPAGLAYLGYQRAGIAFATGRPSTLIADEMGLGKQQPVDTLVATPRGWRAIGDLVVGDEVVGSDGRATRVIGVYPQGIKPSYRVRFSDGCSVEAGPEHLWTVAYRRAGRDWTDLTLTTDQLRERPRVGAIDLAKTPLYLPLLSRPAEFESRSQLPLPAYLVGQLIANGGCTETSPTLTPNPVDWPEIRSRLLADGVVLGAFRQYGSSAHQILTGIVGHVRELGMAVLSASKRVPRTYLEAPVADRVSLLHGLMDGDGHCSKTGNKVTYSTTSEGLAYDVCELVESLGGIASARGYDRSHENKPFEYQVRVRLPSEIVPFTVTRKAQRYVPGSHALPRRTVVDVEYVRDVESVCIAVDAPDRLYATEHYILTHNTIQAIGVINADPSIKRVLVLCPASLRVNWRNEMRKWLTRPMTIELPKNGDLPSEEADVAIVNYDKLVGKSGKAMFDALMGRGFDLLVADEAHFLKNPKAQRTIAVLGKAAHKDTPATPGLASRARRAVFLTGTPILNKPIEAHPLLAALSPAEFGDFFRFAKRYCNAHKEFLPNGKEVWNFNGSSHLDELQERLRKTVMVRRLKADVLKDLPAKRRQIITLTLDDDSTVRRLVEREWAEQEGEDAAIERAIDGEDAYRTRVADLWASQRETAEDRAAAAEEARAFGDDYSHRRSRGSKEKAGVDFTGVSTTRHLLALAKVPAALEYLDGMLEEGVTKVVVFAHHLDVIAQIVEHFGDAAVSITGQTPMDARQAIVDRFQTDSSVKVFVGNLRAAGVGLTLTAASDVVFVELDWVPANVSQAEDRCHRIGQRRSVHVRHLVIDESLEAQMAKVIVEKQDVADAALDDPRAALEITRPVALPPHRAPEGVTVGASGERTYPVATDEQRRLAHLAVRTIAGMCDGAQQEDDMGFNGADTSFGHRLAECETLTDGQVWAATRLARKYRRQLDAGLVEALGVSVKPEKKVRK